MRRRSIALAILLLALLTAVGCTSSPPTSGSPAALSSVPGPASSSPARCPEFSGTESKAEQRLPAVTLPCLGTSASVAMAKAPGVPTVVNLWGSWCVPCRVELPLLEQLQRQAAGKVNVLGVATTDPAANAADFAAAAGLTYPSVVDKDGKVKQALGLQGLPGTVLVDASGAIVATKVGPFASYAELRALVRDKLGVDLP